MTARGAAGRAIAASLLLVGWQVVHEQAVSGIAASSRRPNVVFIRTDDQDLASMRETRPSGELVMKSVDQLLVQRGTSFSNSFVSCSLCCPSRATFLTGQYAHNHGVVQNVWPEGGYYKLDHSNTLPIWLQQAGYFTGHVGKYLNDYGQKGRKAADIANATSALNAPTGTTTAVPPGWSQWFTSFWTSYDDYYVNDNGRIVHFGNDPKDYYTDVMVDNAVDFILHAPATAPWFLVVDFIAPHDGSDWPFDASDPPKSGEPLVRDEGGYPRPAPRHDGLLDQHARTLPPSFNEPDVSDKPWKIRNHAPLLSAEQIAEIDRRYRKRLESLLAVDEGVARICKALDESGRAQETYVFFTSDNGYMQGEHRLTDVKLHPYEESIRVPLIVRGPGVPAGVVVDKLVVNVDCTPTIVEIAQAKAGIEPEGRSLLPLIARPDSEWRTDLLLECPIFHFRGVRTETYAYVEYDYNEDGVVDDVELYNLKRDEFHPTPDPFELENRAREKCYASLMATLSARLAKLKNGSGAACR